MVGSWNPVWIRPWMLQLFDISIVITAREQKGLAYRLMSDELTELIDMPTNEVKFPGVHS